MKIVLTSQQNRAIGNLVEFVGNKREDYICLIGPAGSGKSSVIVEFLDYLPEGLKICFTSPTNKATKVLKNMSIKRGLNVECKTIHSLLGLTMKINRNGEEKLTPSGNSSFDKFDLVVCDEMSMVDSELFDYINKGVMFSSNAKVIFMGDNNQLNPVNETESPTFNIDNKIYLTEVIRQKHGNPILDLCTTIRHQLDNNVYKMPAVETKTNEIGDIGVHEVDNHEMMNIIYHAFTDPKFDSDPDLIRVIAWRNKTVDWFNETIQKIRYPNLDKPFAIGEHFAFSKPMHTVSTFVEFNKNQIMYEGWDKIICPTETEASIVSLEEIEPFVYEPNQRQISKGWIFTKHVVRRYLVTCKLSDKSRHSFVIPADKNELKMLTEFMSTCARTNMFGINWELFYLVQKHFTDIRQVYCITSHRSQGSTYSNVIVHAKDIFCNHNKEESLRSFYVACSRATHNCIIHK
jgi:exodeoxyribonuclease-5